MQSLDSFVHISEPVKDAAGVAWCTGSGYAIRRAAMDAIGGFPTGSLAEDVCCSSVLLGAGWKTAYVHEPLQYGTVPESFGGHIKQRTRWVSDYYVKATFSILICLFPDNRNRPNIVETQLLPLRAVGQGDVHFPASVGICIYNLLPVHHLPNSIAAHNANRLDFWRNPDRLRKQ